MGGVIMFVFLGVLQMPRFSSPEKPVDPTPISGEFPYLIALEPTHLPPAATRIPIHRTVSSESQQPAAQFALSPTATPLVLSNGRTPERIGYSTQGKPIEVYTFGDGEHERMIVAGIHGGNEWNTIALAN